MMNFNCSKIIEKNLILFFPNVPNNTSAGFQSAEVNFFLKNITNSANFSLGELGEKYNKRRTPYSCPAISKRNFYIKLKKYVKIFPETKKKMYLIDMKKKYRADLAYGIFLASVYSYLPFFEKNNIPFIFTLYPGGCFNMENCVSDDMLQTVMSSKLFKKVIVTMPITRDYLIKKKFCDKGKIEYIYGGVPQNESNKNNNQKIQYKQNKDTFDICFVAHRYSSIGEDKGYDVFIETAKILIAKNKEIHFHVVGPWDENIINISGYENNIHFYGIQNHDFFNNFYFGMDLFLSANRASRLALGNFDGFPIGIEAGIAGVGLLVSDPLKMKKFTPLKDVSQEIINYNPDEIANKVLSKIDNLDEFYENCKKLQEKFVDVFDKNKQLQARFKIIKKELI